MKFSEAFPFTFKNLHRQLGHQPHNRLSIVDSCRADDSDFCRETVERGILTNGQMLHAANRYQLGKSRSGKCIFWMIDEQGIVRDGHIGSSSHDASTWVSQQLKGRCPDLARYVHPQHCLFGLHLHSRVTNTKVCVVEKESSAVILSELFPDNTWMASVYPMNFNIYSFEPLQGCNVILFPPTDYTMDTYLTWLELADQARRSYHLNISVSSILEDCCTLDQKSRGIDLLDFCLENSA